MIDDQEDLGIFIILDKNFGEISSIEPIDGLKGDKAHKIMPSYMPYKCLHSLWFCKFSYLFNR